MPTHISPYSNPILERSPNNYLLYNLKDDSLETYQENIKTQIVMGCIQYSEMKSLFNEFDKPNSLLERNIFIQEQVKKACCAQSGKIEEEYNGCKQDLSNTKQRLKTERETTETLIEAYGDCANEGRYFKSAVSRDCGTVNKIN